MNSLLMFSKNIEALRYKCKQLWIDLRGAVFALRRPVHFIAGKLGLYTMQSKSDQTKLAVLKLRRLTQKVSL